MGRIRTTTLGVIALGVLGCTKPATAVTKPPTTAAAGPEAPLTVDAFVRGHGEGATEAEAYARALDQLAETLLGDAGWPRVVPVELHDRTRDPYGTRTDDSSVRVVVGLSKSRAAGVLAEFEYGRPSVAGPEAWRDTLYEGLTAHAALIACQRRESLFGVACDPAQTREVDARLADLTAGLAIVPLREGGVPVDSEGRALRGGRVLTLWHGVPVADVPLHVAFPERPVQSVASGAGGEVEIPIGVGTPWPGPVTLSFDAGALLGPLATTDAPAQHVLDSRAIDPRRWALVFEDGTAADGAFARSLRSVLEPTLGPPVTLPVGPSRALARADVAERARLLVTLADSMTGKVDVVVFARANTRFASRAGGSRVWFEASGHVAVHEAWGAGELGEQARDVTASGVGDRRAEQAAGQKLAEALADDVRASLRISAASASVSWVR